MDTLKVVLVDDHEVVRSGLRALVDDCPGISVIGEASNGHEAIDRARELRPDVIVMDISMPQMDGAAATERIVQEMPDVKVLALTAHEDRGHLTRLMQAGASGYVLKRAAADELVRAIRTIAAGSLYVDPVIGAGAIRTATRMRSARADVDPLSAREEEVLRLIAWGETNKEVAARLGISTKTVETYKARITEKLGLRTRSEMVKYALQKGWLATS